MRMKVSDTVSSTSEGVCDVDFDSSRACASARFAHSPPTPRCCFVAVERLLVGRGWEEVKRTTVEGFPTRGASAGIG